jgi:hypothetical protein
MNIHCFALISTTKLAVRALNMSSLKLECLYRAPQGVRAVMYVMTEGIVLSRDCATINEVWISDRIN